ncbi:MAG: ABC transporter permease [Microbacteriaceae bacterium]
MTAVLNDSKAVEVRSKRFGIWYVAEHKIRVMKGYGWTMVITALGGPMIYLFALGVGLSTLIDHGTGANAALGVSFLLFVAPGLLASSAMMTMAEEMTFTVYGGFKWNPIYEGMVSAPLSGRQIAWGHTLAASMRMFLTVTVYYLILLVFGAATTPYSWLMILSSSLTGAAIGIWLMCLAASIQHDTGQLTLVMRFVITPMFLFSGTFFPLSQLPGFLQWIGWISPLWHGNELGRVLSFGYPEPPWMTAAHLLILLGVLISGLLFAAYAFERRLNK